MIDNTREYILCAAIWFDDGVVHAHQPKNIDIGIVYMWELFSKARFFYQASEQLLFFEILYN